MNGSRKFGCILVSSDYDLGVKASLVRSQRGRPYCIRFLFFMQKFFSFSCICSPLDSYKNCNFLCPQIGHRIGITFNRSYGWWYMCETIFCYLHLTHRAHFKDCYGDWLTTGDVWKNMFNMKSHSV